MEQRSNEEKIEINEEQLKIVTDYEYCDNIITNVYYAINNRNRQGKYITALRGLCKRNLNIQNELQAKKQQYDEIPMENIGTNN